MAMLEHNLGLTSVYALLNDARGVEPKYTTWKRRPKGEIKRTIDYLFFTSQLHPVGHYKLPTEAEVPPERTPSLAYPSDHFALGADFQFS